jgi:hypothetical protein
MTLQLHALLLSEAEAEIRFALMLANSGDRDAHGGLVRIALQQANANQTILFERFFDGSGGSLLAEEVMIAAGDVGVIERSAVLPLAAAEPLLVGGYPSLIPVLAFDTTYHWDGDGDAFGQIACAFVIGAAAAKDGRVTPFRLDLGPRTFAGPAAQPTNLQRHA